MRRKYNDLLAKRAGMLAEAETLLKDGKREDYKSKMAEIGNINDEIDLISRAIIEPVRDLKIKNLGNHNPRLHTDEILVALSICAATNPMAELAMQQLSLLRNCEAHSTVILSQVDENILKKLGIHLTCEPQYQTKKLFHK